MAKMMTALLSVCIMLFMSGCGTTEFGEKSNSAKLEIHFPPTVAAGAKLTVVYSDHIFFEGPTWDPKTGRLYFTAWGDKNKQVLRLDAPGKATVWMDDTAGVNGTFLSTTGTFLTAEVFAHQICEYQIGDKPSQKKILAYCADLHQPNDLCQTPRGDIYFTDPDWANKTTSGVYWLSPSGIVTKIIDDLPAPNGIIASNDGRRLYLGDSVLKLWRSYAINPDGSIGSGRVFFNPPVESTSDPDGMTIDEKGNLYFTGRGGVWVVTPSGKGLGLIKTPEFASNVTFGGPQLKTLYITCQDKVYSLAMNMKGNSPG